MAKHGIDLPESINLDPRQAVISLIPRETRAAKKARVMGESVALMLQSIAPPIPRQDLESMTPHPITSSTYLQAFEGPGTHSMPSGTKSAINGRSIVHEVEAGSFLDSPIFTPRSEACVSQHNDLLTVADTPDSASKFPFKTENMVFESGKEKVDKDDAFSLSHEAHDQWQEAVQGENVMKAPAATKKRRTPLRKKQKVLTPSHAEPGSMDEKVPKKSIAVQRKLTGLRKITEKYHRSVQGGKPEPCGEPKIWADKRQQLCETLPYYRAYEGSTYQNHGIVQGFLIDQEVAVRDKFDDEVIITSVGGGRSPDENGCRGLNRDQPQRLAEPFIGTMKRNLPIVVITGQGNSISPSKLPHVYNVLDWFHITDVWAERSGPKKVMAWRVRLEKINRSEKSWWAAQGSPPSGSQELSDDSQKGAVETCTDCGTSSKVKYNAGWACLEPGCKSFFKFENDYNDATLDYDGIYMNERTLYKGLAPGPLSPPLPTEQDIIEREAYGFEEALKRGIVCSKCNCCIRRVVWDKWDCENSSCDFTHTLPQRTIFPEEVIVKAIEYFEACKKSNSTMSMSDKVDEEFTKGGVLRTYKIYGLWNINEYAIPDEAGKTIGFVRHFKTNGIINQQQDGPNDMFEQLQIGGFGLRRNPARQAGAVGETLTSHFAANFGAPYKFGVKQVSKGFDQAPEVILKAIKRLSWAGHVAAANEQRPFQPFNECLAIGYFEGSLINYHDDGEKTLGPTVATLSIGAPARMKFRPKAKNAVGKLGGKSKTKEAVLQISLRHGDIVVMDGEKIQKLYEHEVKPWGFRYALTCRHIIAERLDTEEERQAAILGGALPPGSESFTYNGDLGATEVIHSTSEMDMINNTIAAKLTTGSLKIEQVREIRSKLDALLASNEIESRGSGVEATPGEEWSQDTAMPDIQSLKVL